VDLGAAFELRFHQRGRSAPPSFAGFGWGKGAFELRRSVVPVEIVDGLSEVAGQPLALRVLAGATSACGLRGLDNCGNCLLVSKLAFGPVGQAKSCPAPVVATTKWVRCGRVRPAR
jgi:hypothetical protein